MAHYEIRDRRPAPALLPAGAVRMLAKRLEEASGLGLIIFACILLLGYLSYAPTDPSPLKAAPGPARNLIGGFGAAVTDVGLQTLGLGWLLLVGVLMLWGLRMFGHRGLTRPWLRVAALPTLMIFAALAFGALPIHVGDSLPAGPGGLIGRLMLSTVEPLGPVLGGLSQGAIGLAAACCAAFAAVFALGFNPWDWPGVGDAGVGAGGVARKAAAAARFGVGETRRRSDAWANRLGALARRLRLAPRLSLRDVVEHERRAPVAAGPQAAPASAAIARARFRAAERKEPSFGDERAEPSFGPAPVPASTPKSGLAAPIADAAAEPVARAVPSEATEGEAEGGTCYRDRIDRSGAPPGPPPAAVPKPQARPQAKPLAAPRAEKKPVMALELSPGGYCLPDPELLDPTQPDEDLHPDDATLEENARLLEATLQDFGVRGEIVNIRPGPVVTQYELEPAPGTKSARVIGLADDIARSIAAVSVRIAVIPGRSVIGIETPNPRRSMVRLRRMLETPEFERTAGKLPLCLGLDIGGAPVVTDLARMPHLLIAGATGSGKSVGVNAMILSLLFRLPPDKCRLVLIDPKMLELSVYDGIPHLLTPVVTDPKKAVAALNWTVREMEGRYRRMSKLGVRNIEGYHQKVAEITRDGACTTRQVQVGFDEAGAPLYEEQSLELDPMPYIVVVVDEMADLMLTAGKEIEASVQRLAQMARAAGIHLIMATQRPSVDVITGVIKANFPSRISFNVTSKIDSRTILGEAGAEQLLGQGDMLALLGGGSRVQRIHGPFVSDAEVEAVAAELRRHGAPRYLNAVTEDADAASPYAAPAEAEPAADELYDQAVALVMRERKVSTSFIQRHLQIGYNRAARLVERMEREGLISEANPVGRREVLAVPA